jgi:hypothetical protein
MYALQIGRDLGSQFLGFDTAVYLETGIYDNHSALEVEYSPFTANLKLERPLVGPLNLYITGGLGFATWESGADDGTSFYAQTSVGVLYNVCERFEVFAGGRLAYLEEASDEEIGWEVGGRINF